MNMMISYQELVRTFLKLNQAYRIENFLLVADFEYALEEHDELAE